MECSNKAEEEVKLIGKDEWAIYTIKAESAIEDQEH